MNALNNVVKELAGYTTLPLIVLLLIGGIYLTVKLGFFQIARFGHIWKETFGKMRDKGEGEGTITPFQAAATALASIIGAGNIVGVAVGISIGGPGSIFWMWLTALLGCATKYSEAVLAVKYRRIDKNGEYFGSPMYYLESIKTVGKFLAMSLAVVSAVELFTSIAVQTNTISGLINSTYGVPKLVTGIVLAVVTLIITAGGISSIGKFAEKLVPTMTLLYLGMAMIVILYNFREIPAAFALIFKHAFTPISAVGGFAGAGLAGIIRQGISRGLYGTEAGLGTAAYTHGSATTTHPSKQALWTVFESFVDTAIVCTVSALLVLTTGVWTGGTEAANSMPTMAMATLFGEGIAGIVLALSITLFAFSTIMALVFYGERVLNYLFGDKAARYLRYIYIIGIIFGSTMTINLVWSLLDLSLALNIIPNMIGVLLLTSQVKVLHDEYFSQVDRDKTKLKV
jgi:AGCS family alanine or glycine:cation symporter